MMNLDADGQHPEPTCIARVKGAVMLRHRMACVVCHSMGEACYADSLTLGGGALDNDAPKTL